jgi:hypothetical protein
MYSFIRFNGWKRNSFLIRDWTWSALSRDGNFASLKSLIAMIFKTMLSFLKLDIERE